MTHEQIAAMVNRLKLAKITGCRAAYALLGATPLDKINADIAAAADLIEAQAAELATLREAMGNNCNALTDADRAYLIAHLSYELEPVGKPPTWNQLAMEVIRLSKDVALKGGA